MVYREAVLLRKKHVIAVIMQDDLAKTLRNSKKKRTEKFCCKNYGM